ncbi:HAMP domain-containing protein [Psychrilyobacter piezotolerans]|uniref:HAMP domain-containing protein n=2 Tax=Fusobacteriaceae TaxID=203492 RepID=A0ABX9KI47_9FUSO|nr:HAMP domain-containing protein [Psychrilyobacter sp. S5]REI41539.1 HAMP domain-containing protein [Psychrilyobacter piezotolerans]
MVVWILELVKMSINKKAIKTKILSLLLGMTSISLLIFLLITSIDIKMKAKASLESSKEVWDESISKSREILRSDTEGYMRALVKSQADYSDSLFNKVESGVNVMSEYAKVIFSDPTMFKYVDTYYREVEPENPQDVSVVNLPPGISRNIMKEQIDLLSNMDYVFRPIYSNDKNLLSVYIGTEDGIYKGFPWRSTLVKDYDPRKRGWYREALKTKDLGWTTPYIDATPFPDRYNDMSKKIIVTCYKAVYDNKENFVGVVASDITVRSLLGIINTQVKDIGTAYIIDKKGKVIAYSGKKIQFVYENSYNLLETENKDYKRIVEKMISGATGFDRYYDDSGKEKDLAYAPILSTGWSLAVEISADKITASADIVENTFEKIHEHRDTEIDGAVNSALRDMMIAYLILIIIIIFVGVKMSNKLSNPIIKLVNYAEFVGRGNLDESIEINTGDEIQLLSESFNKMTRDLKLYIYELKETAAAEEKIENELEIAKRIQVSMLPRIFPPFPTRKEFDIFASMEPAKEVGGDYYDFFLIDENRLCFSIADVSGKGVPASLFMVIAKTLMKNEALRGISAEEVLFNVNNMLVEDNDECLFVTAFICILNIATGEVEYSNAGHNPPLICRKGNSEYEYLSMEKNFVVGGIPGFKFKKENLKLENGDILYLYTDGVTEAMDKENKQYSETRLKKLISEMKKDKRDVYNIEKVIKEDIKEFVDGAEPSDDITMVILKYNGNV